MRETVKYHRALRKKDSAAIQGLEKRLWGKSGRSACTAHHPTGTELSGVG